MPSILIEPGLRIEHAVQQRQRGRLAGAGRADQRDGLARQRGEVQVGDRGALAVIGERHVVELDQAAHAAGIDGVRAGRAPPARVEHLEEFAAAAARPWNSAVGEADRLLEPDDQHAGEAHEGDDLADRREAVDVEPDADARRSTARVSVVEARVSTAQIAHHDSTGICAPSSLPTTLRSPITSASMRAIALHQRDIAERVGGALGEIADSGARPRSAPASVLRSTSAVSPANTTQSTISSSASRQFRNSDSGSSTNSETNAARCSRKNAKPQPPQRIGAGEHDLHQPAGMGAAVEAERQLQDVLEIVGHHRVPAAVRQPVGVQRDQRAAGDGEQAEARPRPRAALSGRSRPDAAAACAPASVSTMRPNRTGSANCAAASETLAMASIQPSLDSSPRSLSTRAYRRMKFMMLWSAQVYGRAD